METALPDILTERLTVVFAGINPGLTAAAAGHHFFSGTNRFWRVIHLAGFTPEELHARHDRMILQHGCGLTTVVGRATARADQLSAYEFAAASESFQVKIRLYAPRFVGFLGKGAYCALIGQRNVAWGIQPATFGSATAWVLPNTSGRNRAFSDARLVHAFRQLYLAASLAPSRPKEHSCTNQ
jgi:double-stranded uracil-DNA glycosylase